MSNSHPTIEAITIKKENVAVGRNLSLLEDPETGSIAPIHKRLHIYGRLVSI
jgi:hypothetical protein